MSILRGVFVRDEAIFSRGLQAHSGQNSLFDRFVSASKIKKTNIQLSDYFIRELPLSS